MRIERQAKKCLKTEERKERTVIGQGKDILGLLLLLVGLFLLGRMVGFCLSPDIWYDEVFSVKMIFDSYREVAHFTADDVHPPFYYWYLKFFVQMAM